MKQELLQLRIESDLLNDLRIVAAKVDRPVSQLVRELIRSLVADEVAITPFSLKPVERREPKIGDPDYVQWKLEQHKLKNGRAA